MLVTLILLLQYIVLKASFSNFTVQQIRMYLNVTLHNFRNWDRWLVAEAPRKSVGPRFEPGCWSFFPCCHSFEQCFQNHY